MSDRYYRAKKDSFMWDEGALLKCDDDEHCVSIDSVWNACESAGDEYISESIIKAQPDWFERVYPVNLLTKTVYKPKAEAKELLSREYASKK